VDDFPQIDPTALSDEALMEMLRALRGSEKHEAVAKQLAKELAIRIMKARKLQPEAVVKILVQGRPKSVWR
jgi:hypothetical protein